LPRSETERERGTEESRRQEPYSRERERERGERVQEEKVREVLLGVGGWSCWTSVEERPSRLEEVGPGWRLDLF